MEETGELARIMARTFGEQSRKPSEKREDMADELADILFVIICLANQTGIDLQKAFEANLVKKSQRDHLRHHGNAKLKNLKS
jgi:NTP pyrophosphatase (non-canonical NTP hydrolase)